LLDYVLSRTTLQDLVATSEGNMSEWMRNHFQAMTQSGRPESSPAAVAVGGQVTVVAPRGKSPLATGGAC